MPYARFPDAPFLPLKNFSGWLAHSLVGVLYVLSGVAFLLDLSRDNDLAYGIVYTPLVATALLHKASPGLWTTTALACLLVVAGAMFPVINADLPDLVANRVLSILAILTTAAFVHYARLTWDRLAAERRRSEAAEQMTKDVLTNLSQEIRTPLHSLLGVLTLTMADSRPDQREALGRVRGDGKLLLATIDNLIDLMQIGAREMQRQEVNVATIAQDAADSARAVAKERQISIAIDPDRHTGRAAAIGDSWAMRRILDNLLANAVRLTPPGGTVSVSVARSADTITASVSDTGMGLAPELADDFRAGAPATDGRGLARHGGMGLALSSRLARAMDGRLTAANVPGAGAIVSLSLPAA